MVEKFHEFKFISKILFYFCLLSIGQLVYAAEGVAGFMFKGHKFGEFSIVRKNIAPWDMTAEELFNATEDRRYAKLKIFTEGDRSILSFGSYALSSIKYGYFNDQLFEIRVDFSDAVGCSDVGRIGEMLRLRYKVVLGNLDDDSSFVRSFENDKLSIYLRCMRAPFELDGMALREFYIVFRDVAAYQRVLKYKMDEDKREGAAEQLLRDRKLLEEVNF